MALTKCSECGHDLSTSAAACPNCGAPVRGVTPPPVPPPPIPGPAVPAIPVPPKSKALRNVLIAAGCLLPIIFVCLVLVWAVSYFGRHSETAETRQESKLQGAITSSLQADLSENKQVLYDKIHIAGAIGLGKAKSDVIQAVSLQWKGDRMTDKAADLVSFTVDHTLYWSTLLTSDGHTKFRDTYDCSGGNPRLVESKVLDTNGDTIEGVTNALIEYTAKQIQKDLTNAIRDASKTSPSPAR
jgi:zinc ribbon protein